MKCADASFGENELVFHMIIMMNQIARLSFVYLECCCAALDALCKSCESIAHFLNWTELVKRHVLSINAPLLLPPFTVCILIIYGLGQFISM